RINGERCTEQWLLPKDILALASHGYLTLYTAPADRALPPRLEPAQGARATPAPRRADGPRKIGKPILRESSVSSLFGELLPCGGGDPIPLRKHVLVVGRGGDCDIVLRVSVVSARHCQLELIEGHWHVRDLDSRHGIRVNGVACKTKQVMP